jgi:aspartyl-tRNA(Asn)/glutamyl-tRNA(Gln) amidotransferase subunit A
MLDDPATRSIAELAPALKAGKLSSVDVIDDALARIAAVDGTLESFVCLATDAREQAVAADRAIRAGGWRGPLHGIPVAVKDNYLTADMPTRAGTEAKALDFPRHDAAVVARLRAAGAIIIGKTRMHEFAWGNVTPPTKNPWDHSRVPGGSSGGSGSAVAARLVPVAMGSDTGGSIRIPASLCGITGLKPTYGRVSRAGVLPLAWSMDHVGPMTRTAADSAVLLRVMAGYDPADASSSVLPVPDYLAALTGDVKGIRVGLLRGFFLESATAEVGAAVEQAAKALASAGAIVDEVALPVVAHVAAASYAVVASEALAYHTGWLKTRAGNYDPEVRKRLQLGAFVTGAHYVRGQQVRALVRDEIDAALAHRDVLLAPATPMTAPRIDERPTTLGDGPSDVRAALIRLTRPFNCSGHPACAVPCGFSTPGLPIGMQLVGRPFDEATVLRVADAYQRLTDWHARRPVLA